MNEAISVLERADLARPEGTDLAELWGDLPEQAADRLGYGVLREKKQRHELWSVLTDLNIRPFTPESVEQYKEIMAEASRPKQKLRDRLLSFAEVACIVAGLLAIGPFFLGWIISWKITAASLAILVGSLVTSCLIGGKTIVGEPAWQTAPLEGYSEAVPEFALEMAVKIHARLPEASMGVCQLVQDERVLDPFLVVEHGPERHYIAVWGEPKFGLESPA